MGLTDTIIFLIIGVIILTVFAPAIISAAGDLLEAIALSLGIIKKTPLELALECAYYRCELGCYSTKVVEEIKWTEGGKEVSCQKFCQDIPDEVMDKNGGKICDVDSIKYPVILNLEENTELNKFPIKNFGIGIMEDLQTVKGYKEIYAAMPKKGSADISLVYVDKNIVYGRGEKNEELINFLKTFTMGSYPELYKSAVIKKGKIKIYHIVTFPQKFKDIFSRVLTPLCPGLIIADVLLPQNYISVWGIEGSE